MISRILVPTGGWRFKQGEYWIYGDSFEDLKKTVTDHRSSNDLPPGNVEEEIEEQIGRLNPTFKVDIIKLKAYGRKHV